MKITSDEIRFTEVQVRALSVKQPFASMILHGKEFETRSWPTEYRGLVLICSSAAPYTLNTLIETAGGHYTRQMQTILGFEGLGKHLHRLPLSQAIAVARMVECRPMRSTDSQRAFVPYFSDLYVHEYEDITPIKPFFWKGAQGWKILTPDQKKLIEIVNPADHD